VLNDLLVLAGEIGPRGTGTSGEAAAADYVAKRLEGLGMAVERSTFLAVASQNAFPIAINLVAMLAVVLYPAGGKLTQWLAAGLSLATAPMLWQTIRTSSNPLRFLLPKVTSSNVFARIKPDGEVRQHIVLLAHLDTNRCRKIWGSSVVRYLEPLAYLTLFVLALLGILYLSGALLRGPSWVWWASLPLAAYVAGSTFSLVMDDRSPFSHGANDNAASVSVLLEIGTRLMSHPLKNSQVWSVFTGAEETDHSGLKTLLEAYDSIMRRAIFFGLEGLGGGEVVYLKRQGMCAHYRPDPGLLTLAERVAVKNPELGVRAAQMIMEDEVGTLRRRGYKALCIAGLDPSTGSLPRWHRIDDTVDSVSTEVLVKAADFVEALLRDLDNGSS
jgi:hypothetical protein